MNGSYLRGTKPQGRTAAAALVAVSLIASGCAPAPPEEQAASFIDRAFTGDAEAVLSLAGEDLITGCDTLHGILWISQWAGGGGAACPADGSDLATNMMLAFFAHAASLNTRPLGVQCGAHADFTSLPVWIAAEPMACIVTATNDLIQPEGTYRADFVFGFRDGAIVAIDEIGHPFEGQTGNLPFPAVADHGAFTRAVDPHCGHWGDGYLDPHSRPQDREWWIEMGQRCALAWREFFETLEDPG